MKKLQCRRNSLLAKWLVFNYNDLPKSICPVFWLTLLSLILAPFAVPAIALSKLVPDAVRRPEKFRGSPLPFVLKAIIGFGLTVIGVLVITAVHTEHGISVWLLALMFMFSSWLFLTFYLAIDTWDERRKQKYGPFAPEPEKGSFGLAWEAIKSAWKHVCKPIDWV